MKSAKSNPDIKRALRIQLVNIEPGLSEHQLHCLKLACFLLDIPRQQLENVDTFIDLYQLIEHKIPQHAPSLIYQMLILVGFPKPLLKGLLPFVKMKIRLEKNLVMDLTLTLSFILGDISEKSYQKFKELARLTFLPEYHTSRILSRSHLLELLQDRNVNILNHLIYMFAWLEAAGCPLQVEYLREFCVRQSLTVPDWSELQLPELGDDYEDNAVDIDGARIDRFILEVMAKHQRCHFCTVKCTICSVLLVVLPLILTILSISTFGIFYIGLKDISLHSVHNIGSNTSVIIEPNCYNSFWIKKVIISNTEGYGKDPVTATFYKTNVNNLHFTPKQLKGRKERYNPIGVTYRKHMNYLVDAPIYSAGNSTLTYAFSFRADVNFTICPLELHMFNDYQKYRRYLQRPFYYYNGPISSPDCTLNSVNPTLQTHIVNFHLHPNTFYYFAVGLTKGLYVNITINGQLEEFQVSNLTPEKCLLNVDTLSCTIEIANSSLSFAQDYICLLAQSNSNNQKNITVDVILANWNVGSVTCLSFSAATGFITVCIILALVVYIIWHVRKESLVISQYTDLLTD